jgi:hypothetical protein
LLEAERLGFGAPVRISAAHGEGRLELYRALKDAFQLIRPSPMISILPHSATFLWFHFFSFALFSVAFPMQFSVKPPSVKTPEVLWVPGCVFSPCFVLFSFSEWVKTLRLILFQPAIS